MIRSETVFLEKGRVEGEEAERRVVLVDGGELKLCSQRMAVSERCDPNTTLPTHRLLSRIHVQIITEF